MDSDSRSYWIITCILILLAAFFALAETAISSVSRNRIRTEASRGDSRAVKALYVLDHFESAITTLLICTNIVHIAAASIVTVAVTKIWGLSAVSLSTVITTIVVFFAGEMLPKSIAKKKPETFTLKTAGTLVVLMKLLAPLSMILSKIGSFVSKKVSQEPEVSVTEEELYDIIEDMNEEGSIDDQQAGLLSSALRFSKKTAGDIMTPIEQVICVNIEDDTEKILDTIRNQNHSRVPVYRGDRDHIIGMLQIRKVLKAWIMTEKIPALLPLLDRVYFTTPDIEVDELLDRMSAKKVTMAIVRERKNGGNTLGIVSVEDILEELVGEIYDEDDRKPAMKTAGDEASSWKTAPIARTISPAAQVAEAAAPEAFAKQAAQDAENMDRPAAAVTEDTASTRQPAAAVTEDTASTKKPATAVSEKTKQAVEVKAPADAESETEKKAADNGAGTEKKSAAAEKGGAR